MYSPMEQPPISVSSTTMDSLVPHRSQNRRSRHVYSTYIPNSRFSRYNNTLMSLLPIRLNENNSELSVQNAGLLSFITFHWIVQYLNENFRKKIGVLIPGCPKVDSCRVNSARLDGLFVGQTVKQGQKNLSIWRVVWNFVRTRTIFACFLYIFASLISMLGLVLFLPKILSGNDLQQFSAFKNLIFLVLTELLSCFMYSWSNAINLRTAIRLRSACFASLYRQAMLTSLTYNISNWQLVSFLMSEGQHIHDLVMAIPNLICTPIILICCMLFAGTHLYLWGYLSVVIIFALFPIFLIIGFLSKKLMYRAAFFSDQRVKLFEEFILNNIHVKFMKMEKWFKTNISEKRKKEVESIKRTGLNDNLCFSFILLQPFLSFTCLFIAYSVDIKLSTFAAICIILLIHLKQSLDNFWYGLNSFIKGLAAFNKFKGLMNHETIYNKDKKPKQDNVSIFIENASFQLTKTSLTNNDDRTSSSNILNSGENCNRFSKNSPLQDVLRDISITIEHGKLIGLCGMPGSGRSSLLLAIMGLLLKSKGKRETAGRFAYINQDPIIFNDTIKNNILFGSALDSQRYYHVTLFCELQEFLSQMPEQDDTIIDAKLLSLEQKQRIVLARALYENGDIYLLDEPLSALEYHKSLNIFVHAIKDYLHDKTIILVTDQIKFLEQCDEVFMLQNGKILYQGHHNSLLKYETLYEQFIEYLRKQKTVCKDKSSLFEISSEIPNSPKEIILSANSLNYNLLVSNESIPSYDNVDNTILKLTDSRAISHETRTVLQSYFSHFGNCFSLTFLILTQVLNASLISFLPVYFIFSLTDENKNYIHLSIYFGLFLWMLIFGILMNIYFNQKMFSASVSFHNEILKKLYKASLSFFQSKSLSIISIISVQLQLTDNDIPYLIQNIFLNISIALMTICVIFFASPFYIIILTIIILAIIIITIFVRRALINFNRFGMNYTDKLYTEIMKMLNARPIIQAYNKVEYFSKSFYDTYDEFMIHLYIMYAAKNWFQFVLHCFAVLLIALIGSMLVFFAPTCSIGEFSLFSSGSLNENVMILSCKALTIVCTLQICYILQKIFMLYLNTSLTFNVLSEIQKFKMSITTESPKEEMYEDASESDEEEYKILEDQSQSVKLVNVSLNIEVPVINSLSLYIQENEKMGFLGLKSSERKAIIAILYKLSNISSGSIFIGKKRINQIPLKYLRTLISVVPSEPNLFNLSIKKILSVGNDFPEPVAQILKKFLLFERVNLLPNCIESVADQYLNTEEKQILCLAQAYIKQTPIIIVEDFVNGSIFEYILGTQIRLLFPLSTMLIFANDVKGLKSCDKIAIFKDGKIDAMDNSRLIIKYLSQIPETNL